MKSKLLYSIMLLALFLSGLQDVSGQSYKWIRGGGTSQDLSSMINKESVYNMCTDPNGNVYALSTVGINAVTADTFYWPGGVGSSQSILFTSHSCTGQMRFAKLITGTGNLPYGIEADNAGHVYIAFESSHSGANPLRIRYDTTITAYGNNRVALAQYDTLGDLKWIRFIGADAYETSGGTGGVYNYLALDGAQNPHLTAIAEYGVTLTPTFTTTQTGFYDHTFDVAGNLLSMKMLDIDSTLRVDGITIDKQSNKLYTFGMRFPSFWATHSRYSFIAALDVDRNRIWIDTLSNPYYPNVKNFGAVITDNKGNLYSTIVAPRGVAFRGDTAKNVLTTGAQYISVVMKTDTAGNPKWMRTYSSDLSVNSLVGLTLMGSNKLATCGGTVGMLVGGFDTIYSYTGEGQSAYFSILDTAGYVHTIQQLHGAGFYDWANKVVVGKAGNLYIGGKLESNIWGGSLTPYTSVGGDSDYFIMKYGVDCGCTSMPVANYNYSGSDFIRNFTYTGTPSIDSVRWSFGDGGTSTILNPSHTYTMAGTYTVCVRIYSPCGNDMKCYEVNVSCAAMPVASYVDTGNLVRGFVYTGTTTALYDSVRWSFGDGMHDTGLHVIHTYPSSGNYTVCAIIYTRCGNDTVCNVITVSTTSVFDVNAITADIKVYPNPTAASLYVTGVTGSIKYRLTNMVGATVQSGTLSQNMEAIDISLLAAGVYVLEIGNENGDRKVMRVRKE